MTKCLGKTATTRFEYAPRAASSVTIFVSEVISNSASTLGGPASYKPFNDAHLRLIFEPRTFLAFNRAVDYFLAPLPGVHLG